MPGTPQGPRRRADGSLSNLVLMGGRSRGDPALDNYVKRGGRSREDLSGTARFAETHPSLAALAYLIVAPILGILIGVGVMLWIFGRG